MKISGHRTRSMLDRYNIQDEQDIQEAMIKVSEYVSTLPVESQVVSLEKAKKGGGCENTDSFTDNFAYPQTGWCGSH